MWDDHWSRSCNQQQNAVQFTRICQLDRPFDFKLYKIDWFRIQMDSNSTNQLTTSQTLKDVFAPKVSERTKRYPAHRLR